MMRMFFLWSVLLGLIIFAVFYIGIRPSIINDLKNNLSAAGIVIEDIQKIKVSPSGFKLINVALDKEGFNKIKSIETQISWHIFWKQPIKAITIHDFEYSSIFSQSLLSRSYNNLDALKFNISSSNIPSIKVENFVWDISTSLGPIRINGDLEISTQSNQMKIKSSLNTSQHALNFQSQIVASLKNKTEKWDFNILDAKINSQLLSFSRANAWFNYTKTNNTSEFSGQLDAGSGLLLSAPLNDIQIIAARKLNEPHIPVILRAQLTGSKNSNLITDIQISPNIENQDLQLKLIASSANDFLDYLKVNKFISGDSIEFSNQENFSLDIQHMKERRFEDGPYPFAFTSVMGGKQSEGTFIFYPDDFTLRGSTTGDRDLLNLISNILLKNDLSKNENTLRFEKNLLKEQLFN